MNDEFQEEKGKKRTTQVAVVNSSDSLGGGNKTGRMQLQNGSHICCKVK